MRRRMDEVVGQLLDVAANGAALGVVALANFADELRQAAHDPGSDAPVDDLGDPPGGALLDTLVDDGRIVLEGVLQRVEQTVD